jgi:hypothetical protein
MGTRREIQVLGRARGFAVLGAAFALLAPNLAASPASASTGDIISPQHEPEHLSSDGWQAGTCTKDSPTCSIDTPTQFFEQAGAHPQVGFTQFIVKHEPPGETPVGELKTIRVDLPVGLSVNPGATVRCSQAEFEASSCPGPSRVGTSFVTSSPPPLGIPLPPLEAAVFNLVPQQGQPARFGLNLAGKNVYLEADDAWDTDYHEGFTIHVPAVSELPLLEGVILKNRLVFDGRAGDGTFITTPTTCLGPAVPPHEHTYSTYLLASSVAEESSPGYDFATDAPPAFESPIPAGTFPKACDTIPYEPSLAIDPGTVASDSPAGAAVQVEVPHLTGAESEQDSSDTRAARLTLPVGMGLNPSAADGLEACSDEEFGKGTRSPVSCPAGSKIGTVEIETPPLPEGNLSGEVYVGRQLSRDPTSGDEYRIFVDAESARYGISARLIGNVRADPRTGQLTTTFTETPQVPFSSFKLDFDDGARAVLSSPPTCGPNDATAEMTPWSGNAPATPSQPIVLTTAPGGGPCAKTLAARLFGPGFEAKPPSAKAGAFSPLSMHLTRSDGEQELKGVDVTLAPGMTGRLAGIPYCPEAAIAAAAANGGLAEKAGPSCPATSQVGTASVASGTGPAPIHLAGKVFLSGPYHGAPLSLAVVTPATAGPFDLGTAVVRVALFVDPDTAQVHAVSDPIPSVFGGAQLSIRSVDADLDRKDFTLNPTSCGPLVSSGAIKGGGSDPADPAAFSSVGVGTPFQTTECEALGFAPKLTTTLLGGRKTTKRSRHPKFRAVLLARGGDANIGAATLILPHSEFLDQSHIRTICTRVQLAAQTCPAGSVYGFARARTPLLDDELAGPVYLVASDHELPDLLVDLKGQVEVRLHGVISATKARIKNVFSALPDVPVSRFELTMKGGKRGLLVNSRNLCARPAFSYLRFKAQNGKELRKKRLPLRVSGCHRG